MNNYTLNQLYLDSSNNAVSDAAILDRLISFNYPNKISFQLSTVFFLLFSSRKYKSLSHILIYSPDDISSFFYSPEFISKLSLSHIDNYFDFLFDYNSSIHSSSLSYLLDALNTPSFQFSVYSKEFFCFYLGIIDFNKRLSNHQDTLTSYLNLFYSAVKLGGDYLRKYFIFADTYDLPHDFYIPLLIDIPSHCLINVNVDYFQIDEHAAEIFKAGFDYLIPDFDFDKLKNRRPELLC